MLKPKVNKIKFRKKIKQYFYRLNFKKIEKIRFLLKIIVSTKYIEKQFKVISIFYLVNLNKNSYISKHKNICLFSSWKRSVQPKFKLNRLSFIENSEKLYLPGISNARW